MSEQSAEYRYASNLATALAQKHWPENTKWELLPDTLGVLAQIDNMTTLMDDQKREIERLRAWLTEIAKVADDESSGPEAVSLGMLARDALAGKSVDD